VGIAGHSYGGYVALAALTLTPDLFRCAAASSTASNLVAFVSRFPKTPGNAWVRTTVGDPEIPEEAERLRGVSPFFLVDRLNKPLLMARGTEDGALFLGDFDVFLAEIEKRGGSAESVVYEGDGYFFRWENELDYYARVERLFAAHLGGCRADAGGPAAGIHWRRHGRGQTVRRGADGGGRALKTNSGNVQKTGSLEIPRGWD
jgi:dipeptidyl aminopeptidase/acylaminoacyl peptidase